MILIAVSLCFVEVLALASGRDALLGRSTLYSGMQTKSEKPVYFGLVWNDHDDERGTFFFRERSVPTDLLTTIRVKRCDGLNFCSTEVRDTLHTDLRLKFRWVKPTDKNDSFSLQVDGWSEDLTFGQSYISLYSYIGTSGKGAKLSMSSSSSIDGYDPDFGNFRLVVNSSQKGENYYFTNQTETPFFMTDTNFQTMMIHGVNETESPACCFPWNHRRVLPNLRLHDDPNIVVFQTILETPFTINFNFFNPNGPPSKYDFEELYDKYEQNFEQNFDESYPIFNFLQNETTDTKITKDEWREFALTTFSSLMTGLSYYEGVSYYKDEHENVHQNPTTHKLLSMVPSKKGFPHPFYWDESFHQMVSLRMFPDLHETVTKYWYDIQNSTTGWVAREQVIGDESLALCPQWAWADSVKNMNPPTYFFASEMFVDIYAKTRSKSYLHSLYNQFKKTANWYLTNTESKYTPLTFKWNGRMGDGSYDSGLDDFPRGTNQPSDTEIHIDLQSWIGRVMKVMKKFAGILGLSEDEKYYGDLEFQITRNIQKYFWNEDVQFYTDVNDPKTRNYANHIGVIGLLPICLALEDNITRVDLVLDKIQDELFDENGIMSLSKLDPWFFRDGDYWRGNIWLNQQFLCFRGLKYYEDHFGMERAKMLRKKFQVNLAQMMYKNYVRPNGGIYETYHPKTGKGYNHRIFTGWSTLIVLIMAEDYR